jgi:hypothetical protein
VPVVLRWLWGRLLDVAALVAYAWWWVRRELRTELREGMAGCDLDTGQLPGHEP